MTLDDSVLRGVCFKCNLSIHFKGSGEYYEYQNCPDGGCCLPKWFLNAKQIWKIGTSKDFGDWIIKKKTEEHSPWTIPIDYFLWLKRFLEEEPFLVAKILKENDKK